MARHHQGPHALELTVEQVDKGPSPGLASDDFVKWVKSPSAYYTFRIVETDVQYLSPPIRITDQDMAKAAYYPFEQDGLRIKTHVETKLVYWNEALMFEMSKNQWWELWREAKAEAGIEG